MGLQGSRFADRKTTPRLSGREKERPRVERRILSPVRNEVVLVGVRLTWLVALFGAASADCLYKACCRVDCFARQDFPWKL